MAITHDDGTRTNFADQVNTNLGAGANMVLKAAGTPTSTIPLNNPVFDAAVAGVMNMDVVPVPEDSNATGGASVTTFELQTSGGTAVVSGAVPADLTLTKNPIVAGDTVQITSFSYTASP